MVPICSHAEEPLGVNDELLPDDCMQRSASVLLFSEVAFACVSQIAVSNKRVRWKPDQMSDCTLGVASTGRCHVMLRSLMHRFCHDRSGNIEARPYTSLHNLLQLYQCNPKTTETRRNDFVAEYSTWSHCFSHKQCVPSAHKLDQKLDTEQPRLTRKDG